VRKRNYKWDESSGVVRRRKYIKYVVTRAHGSDQKKIRTEGNKLQKSNVSSCYDLLECLQILRNVQSRKLSWCEKHEGACKRSNVRSIGGEPACQVCFPHSRCLAFLASNSRPFIGILHISLSHQSSDPFHVNSERYPPQLSIKSHAPKHKAKCQPRVLQRENSPPSHKSYTLPTTAIITSIVSPNGTNLSPPSGAKYPNSCQKSKLSIPREPSLPVPILLLHPRKGRNQSM